MKKLSEIKMLMENVLSEYNQYLKDREELSHLTKVEVDTKNIVIGVKYFNFKSTEHCSLPISFNEALRCVIQKNLLSLMQEAIDLEQERFDTLKQKLDELSIELVKQTSSETSNLDQIKQRLSRSKESETLNTQK